MRTLCLLLIALLGLAFLSVPNTLAQTRTADMNLAATANNVGIFTCTLNVLTFDFGDVDSDGALLPGTGAGVAGLGRNGSDNGGSYETVPGTITWVTRAAPASTVRFHLVAAPSDHTGSLPADNLEIRMPSTAGGTSTDYQAFTSLNDLITGMSVGNGANAANGEINLRLNVLDADPTGSNTWTVRIRATGTP